MIMTALSTNLFFLCLFIQRSSSLSLEGVLEPSPNFVFILTDDQDVLLGGITAMPTLQSVLKDNGMEFRNAFVDTPICCPSRTSTLSGLLGHNLGQQNLQNWCGNFTNTVNENRTWITRLGEAGYNVGLSGKYHNAPPQGFVPKGWSDFFSLNNECQYYNNSYNDNGKTRKYGDTPADYMTSTIGNRSIAFIKNSISQKKPFFAYIAPHASHMPTTVAPWYLNATLPSYRAPRTPQYNFSGENKHWVVAEQDPLSDILEVGIDDIFTARHRALLSVDDIIKEVYDLLDSTGELANTYWIYSSDHGYNLGNFRLPVEKFHVFEQDITVPFLVRGPGVAPGSVSSTIVSNIDIGATILDLAGLPPAETPTDGRSFASSLGVPQSQTSSLFRSAAGRDRAIIEYGRWGTGYVVRGACQISCGICDDSLSRLLDAPSHTYSGLRIINSTHNLAFFEFSPDSIVPAGPMSTNWTELYDLTVDPFELVNIAANGANSPLVKQLSKELWSVANCKGEECP